MVVRAKKLRLVDGLPGRAAWRGGWCHRTRLPPVWKRTPEMVLARLPELWLELGNRRKSAGLRERELLGGGVGLCRRTLLLRVLSWVR